MISDQNQRSLMIKWFEINIKNHCIWFKIMISNHFISNHTQHWFSLRNALIFRFCTFRFCFCNKKYTSMEWSKVAVTGSIWLFVLCEPKSSPLKKFANVCMSSYNDSKWIKAESVVTKFDKTWSPQVVWLLWSVPEITGQVKWLANWCTRVTLLCLVC